MFVLQSLIKLSILMNNLLYLSIPYVRMMTIKENLF